MELFEYQVNVTNAEGGLDVTDVVHATSTDLYFNEVVKASVLQAYREGEEKPFYVLVVPSTHTLSIYKTHPLEENK